MTETREWESDDAYGYGSGTPIRLRIDKEPPISNFSDYSTDGTGAFLVQPTAILEKMLRHTKLIA
jgi:hypothetical protein